MTADGLRSSAGGTIHRTERTTAHRVVVLPPLTEPQYLALHALFGTEHPGRFKPWVNDEGRGGFAFEPPPVAFGTVCRYAAEHGLRFRTETTTTVEYTPARGDRAVEPPPASFGLDPDGLRAWLAERAAEAGVDPSGAEELTFDRLCSEDVHHALESAVAELAHRGVLREPAGWNVRLYALDDLDQWGYLVTVQVSSRAMDDGAPFFQVTDLSADISLDDGVRDRLNDVVATANALLPFARAARVGTDPHATHHPDGMCKAHSDYDCGEDECRSASLEPPAVLSDADLPAPLIRVVFNTEDVLNLAEDAGVADEVALDRASRWAPHIESTAVQLCNEQLASVVAHDVP